MSQHLIIDFINRNPAFKPVKGGKIVNSKLKKYQGSNRDNNGLPQALAQGSSPVNKVQAAVANEQGEENSDSAKKIDITI